MSHIHLPQALIERFDVKGEKTSWSYIAINAELATQIHDSDKKSFRGKGTMDGTPFAQIALMPMGEGQYILPINAVLRKAIGKKPGDRVHLMLEKDDDVWMMNSDLEACLRDAKEMHDVFIALPLGHQRYFSNWIESTKNPDLRAERIMKTIYAMEHGLNYAQMIQHFKARSM